MRIKISWQYIIAFIALNMIMGELHEQAHINTGFLICGCYGPRDFSVWMTCETCSSPSLAYFSTLAGPLFSCILMWVGALWFAKSSDHYKKQFGFSLLFANLPFARIFTALMGGGDEKVFIQALMGDQTNSLLSKIIASIVVILVCLPPMIIVARNLLNKNRGWIIVAFATIPLVYGMLYQKMFLNGLFKNGFMSDVHFLGTPDMILAHTALMLLLLLLFRKGLFRLKDEHDRVL